MRAGKPEPFLTTPLRNIFATFSPDGRWLAYASEESGRFEVYVRPFPAPASGGKWLISNRGGTNPVWARNGRELLYWAGDQIMAVSYTVQGDSLHAEKPRVWAAKLRAPPNNSFDLAPDGTRAALVTPVETLDAPTVDHEVVFLLNFFDELRRRVPVGRR